MTLHRCTEGECPFVGQRTGRGCRCHKTDEQVLRENSAAMLTALRAFAVLRDSGLLIEGDAAVSTALDCADAAIAKAKAAGL